MSLSQSYLCKYLHWSGLRVADLYLNRGVRVLGGSSGEIFTWKKRSMKSRNPGKSSSEGHLFSTVPSCGFSTPKDSFMQRRPRTCSFPTLW